MLYRPNYMAEGESGLLGLNIGKEAQMGNRFFIRGYREKAEFPSLCDEESYSLKEAMNKSREYFKKIKAISKIILFEQEETDKKRAPKIVLNNNVVDIGEMGDWWKND